MKADKNKLKKFLHMVQGQLKGIENMMDNDEYCINISNQLMASIAILKKINNEILSTHLKHCVLNANKEELESKINEISEVIKRLEK
jgi:DNA-binding FrmR family transcriptional regulator